MRVTLHSRSLSPALAALAVALALSGCTPTNSELTIGDPLRSREQVVLPSIGRGSAPTRSRVRARDMAGRIIRPALPPSESPRDETLADMPPEPSITSLDRSEWTQTRFLVPNDAVAHQPRYTNLLRFDQTSQRARGDFPTLASAVDTATSRSADQQIKEAVAGPFVAAADLMLAPVRAFAARPWNTTRTGFDRYQRFPQERTVVPEGLFPVLPEDQAPPADATDSEKPESESAK